MYSTVSGAMCGQRDAPLLLLVLPCPIRIQWYTVLLAVSLIVIELASTLFSCHHSTLAELREMSRCLTASLSLSASHTPFALDHPEHDNAPSRDTLSSNLPVLKQSNEQCTVFLDTVSVCMQSLHERDTRSAKIPGSTRSFHSALSAFKSCMARVVLSHTADLL